MFLTDAQWQILQPLFPDPPAAPRPGRPGRPPLEPRPILDAILWKIATGAAWYDLPLGAPPHQTVYRYYRQWQKSGLLDEVIQLLIHDLQTRQGFDLQAAFAQGHITLTQVGRRLHVQAAPHLLGAPQLATALLFVSVVEQQLKQSRRPSTPGRRQARLALLQPPPDDPPGP